MKKRMLLAVSVALVAMAATANRAPAGGETFTLTPIAVGFNNPIGIDHHPPTNQVLMSVNYSDGEPHNLELVAPNGDRTTFSTLHGLTDELKIASVRDTIGGFTPGEVFTGNGQPGQIIRISPDGNTIANPWVTLPDETGLLRGGLYVDRTGVYEGHLLVCTTAGNVWEIDAEGQVVHPSGEAKPLATIPAFLEGITAVPDDADSYGPWAGKILVGIGGGEAPGEGNSNLATVDREGHVELYNLHDAEGTQLGVEDIDLIPEEQNFFGVDFGGQTLWGAGPEQFESMVGDILIAQESPGYLWHVRFENDQAVATKLTTVPQWEHVTFSPAGLDDVDDSDGTPPVGDVASLTPGKSPTVGILMQDPTTGLASVAAGSLRNVRLQIPAIPRGTASPVALQAVMGNPKKLGRLLVNATDVAGNKLTAAMRLVQLAIPSSGKNTQSLLDLPASTRFLRLRNGAKGAMALTIRIPHRNPVKLRLAPGAASKLDVSAAHGGSIVLKATGTPGGRVLAVASDF